MFQKWLTGVQKTAQAARTRERDQQHYQHRTTKKAAGGSSVKQSGSTLRDVGTTVPRHHRKKAAEDGLVRKVEELGSRTYIRLTQVEKHGVFRKNLRPLVDNLLTKYLHKVYAIAQF